MILRSFFGSPSIKYLVFLGKMPAASRRNPPWTRCGIALTQRQVKLLIAIGFPLVMFLGSQNRYRACMYMFSWILIYFQNMTLFYLYLASIKSGYIWWITFAKSQTQTRCWLELGPQSVFDRPTCGIQNWSNIYIYIYINYVHISKGAAGENLKAVLRLLFPLVRQSGTTTFCQLMGSVWGGGVWSLGTCWRPLVDWGLGRCWFLFGEWPQHLQCIQSGPHWAGIYLKLKTKNIAVLE